MGLYIIPLTFNDRRFNHKFYVIDNLAADIICGIDFINDHGFSINGKLQKIILPTINDENMRNRHNNANSIHAIYCPKTVTVSGFNTTAINCPTNASGDRVFLPTSSGDINAAASIVQVQNGTIPILLQNRSWGPTTIPRGELLGCLVENTLDVQGFKKKATSAVRGEAEKKLENKDSS
jgi:hypothetical protein